MPIRTVAFVPVRLTSSRLPRKHLRTIGSRSLIAWVIKRLKDSREIGDIVLCAPEESASDALREVAAAEDVHLYVHRGAVDDVVGRLTTAANLFEAEACVLASGDCPLLCPATIDKLVDLLARRSADFVAIKPHDDRPAIHEGLLVTRRWVWERADALSDRPELREHLFPILFRHPELFAGLRVTAIEDDEIFYALRQRISVDTPADLEFMRRLYDALAQRCQPFDLASAIAVLLGQPELRRINVRVHQKTIGESTRRVLFLVAASRGDATWKGTIDLASALVHDLGIGVTFVVFDETIATELEQQGYGVEVGRDRVWAELPSADLALIDTADDTVGTHLSSQRGIDMRVLPLELYRPRVSSESAVKAEQIRALLDTQSLSVYGGD